MDILCVEILEITGYYSGSATNRSGMTLGNQWSWKVGPKVPIWMRRVGWLASKGLFSNGVTAPHKCILLWDVGSHHHWMGREYIMVFPGAFSNEPKPHRFWHLILAQKCDHLPQDVQEMPHILLCGFCLKGDEIIKSLWTGFRNRLFYKQLMSRFLSFMEQSTLALLVKEKVNMGKRWGLPRWQNNGQ